MAHLAESQALPLAEEWPVRVDWQDFASRARLEAQGLPSRLSVPGSPFSPLGPGGPAGPAGPGSALAGAIALLFDSRSSSRLLRHATFCFRFPSWQGPFSALSVVLPKASTVTTKTKKPACFMSPSTWTQDQSYGDLENCCYQHLRIRPAHGSGSNHRGERARVRARNHRRSDRKG